jgi:hypothetical protein
MSPAEYVRRVEAGEQPQQTSPGPVSPTTNPLVAGPKLYTLGQLHDDFLDFRRQQADEQTYIHYRDKLKDVVKRFGNRPLNTITEEDGLSFWNWLRKERVVRWCGETRKGMKACSVTRYYARR